MKNLLLKICIAVLLISTVSATSTITPLGNNTAEAAKIDHILFATPNQAKTIGKSFTTSAIATRQDLNLLSDILDEQQMYRSIHAGIMATLITAPLKKRFSIPSGFAGALISAYAGDTNAKTVTNALKKSSKSQFLVQVTYVYRQTGSGDGYYYISNIKIT